MAADQCSNCGGPDGQRLSFDLDLPTIVLCGICSLAIVSDRELFDDLGRHHRNRTKRGDRGR